MCHAPMKSADKRTERRRINSYSGALSRYPYSTFLSWADHRYHCGSDGCGPSDPSHPAPTDPVLQSLASLTCPVVTASPSASSTRSHPDLPATEVSERQPTHSALTSNRVLTSWSATFRSMNANARTPTQTAAMTVHFSRISYRPLSHRRSVERWWRAFRGSTS